MNTLVGYLRQLPVLVLTASWCLSGCAVQSTRDRVSEIVQEPLLQLPYIYSLILVDMEPERDIELQAQESPAPESPALESSAPWTNSKVLKGFPQTAHLLAADPDKSTIILKRFDKASIRNLLYVEGRVAAMEADQEQLDREDKTKYKEYLDIAEAAKSWEEFALLGTGFGNGNGKGKAKNTVGIPKEVYQIWMQRILSRHDKLREKRGELHERLIGRFLLPA